MKILLWLYVLPLSILGVLTGILLLIYMSLCIYDVCISLLKTTVSEDLKSSRFLGYICIDEYTELMIPLAILLLIPGFNYLAAFVIWKQHINDIKIFFKKEQ